jgi:hypothetical protein
MADDAWRALAARQGGLLTRAQLPGLGIDRWYARRRISSERWIERSPNVIGTTTGELTRTQLMWLGVLHAGDDAMVGDLTAAELAGLKNWDREQVTILVPHSSNLVSPCKEIVFVETRRSLAPLRRSDLDLPTCRIEPAVLHFAAYKRSFRTAQGVLAAVVQQRLTTAGALNSWVDKLRPLRWADRFRQILVEIDGGAQSVAELDVRRMCRGFGLAAPTRQTKRRDSSGRVRYTDCEWPLPDGRILVLEVDGAFHMDVEHWEDDLARQRGLTDPGRIVVRCTARELRDEPAAVARDLRNLGVAPESSESA